jgi:hypothetical protein
MREHLQLTWLEWMALRFLVKSKRVGLLVLKPYGSRLAFVAKDMTDPIGMEHDEPLSMQLERMYHQPSFGELDE